MELKDETGSNRKRRKKFHDSEGKHVCTEEVGIGKLPDEMLCHILSFLGTKDAVQNSVLSKRWRYFWTSVPCIDIRYPNDRCCIYFIHKFLRLNTVSCLRKFSLSWSLGYEVLSELISVVLNRDIEEIVLTHTQFGGDRYIQLPPSIFTCKKLVVLNLGSGIFLDVPSLVDLPSLKILHIHVGQFFYKDSITKILDGCPVIAELNIRLVEAVNTLFVQSSLVKILNIYLNWFGRPGDLRVVVDVPNVERLDLTSRGNVQYDIGSLSSLVKLNTSIRQDSGVVELLRKFTNTKYMKFSHETLTSLECQPLDDFPIFRNLTHLVVDFHEYSRTVLPVLLECSPNLVTLVFYSAGKGRSHEEQLHHFKAPKCKMLYLEEIELRGLKGFMHETEMISYFLKNSMVLKKMLIKSVYSGAKKYSEISKTLLTFPRISPECQIMFD